MEPLQIYDLAIAWNWEYDRDFVQLVQETSHLNKLSVLEICTKNVEEIFDWVKKGEIKFRYFLDRASDEDDAFQPLARFVLQQFRAEKRTTIQPINVGDFQIRAADKATMHLEFLAHNIDVPYTIIISPYNYKQEVELTITELAKVGRPFIIKPANTTGGGIGVVMGAKRRKLLKRANLIKTINIYYKKLSDRLNVASGALGFGALDAFGDIIPVWWNDVAHIYSLLSENEEQQLGLGRLRKIDRMHLNDLPT